MTYPIAEIFHSIQGEGRWCGTPMMFVRLAGCNVGKYAAVDQHGGIDVCDILPNAVATADFPLIQQKQHSICTTFDGQKFLCDTDYHATLHLTAEEIAAELKGEGHVCITGGEPFLHDLAPLAKALDHNPAVSWIHLETSGTLPYPKNLEISMPWVTCSPKKAGSDSLKLAFGDVDEWKVLVGENFNLEEFAQLDKKISGMVDDLYLQPINGVNDLWEKNFAKVMTLLKEFPHWKLSPQLHKFLEVR